MDDMSITDLMSWRKRAAVRHAPESKSNV
ncbi:GpE family phage tail protein [Asticcacaulis endophyticus]